MRSSSSAPEIAGSLSASSSGGGATSISSIVRCTDPCALLTAQLPRSYVPRDSHGYHTTWAIMAQQAAQGRFVKLSDQVTRELARRIANGEFGEDVPLPTEFEICQEFDVSKTTAREVIRSLAERGFVDVRQGRRMQLRRASEWNQLDPLMIELIDDPGVARRYLADVHYVRTLIEPEVAARAALQADDDQIARASAAVEAMETLTDDPDAYLEADVAFH